MGISYRALRVWQRNWDVFLYTWPSQVAFTVIEPLLTFLALGIGLGNYVILGGDTRYLNFFAPGLLAAFAMFSSASECAWGTFIRMEHQRTFDAMIVTPVNIEDVIAGEILWGATRVVETSVFVLLAMLLFQVDVAPTALLVVPAMFLQGIVFAAAGVVVVSIIPTINQLNHFFSLFLLPQYMFSGVFFPLAAFPGWVATLAWFMPLTHGVHLARGLVSGDTGPGLLGDALWLLVAGAVLSVLALRLMRRRLIK